MKRSDDGVAGGLAGVLAVVLLIGGFFLGRYVTWKEWERRLEGHVTKDLVVQIQEDFKKDLQDAGARCEQRVQEIFNNYQGK